MVREAKLSLSVRGTTQMGQGEGSACGKGWGGHEAGLLEELEENQCGKGRGAGRWDPQWQSGARSCLTSKTIFKESDFFFSRDRVTQAGVQWCNHRSLKPRLPGLK